MDQMPDSLIAKMEVPEGFSRRQFLITLGLGAGAVSGYFLFKPLSPATIFPSVHAPVPEDCPRLSHDVMFGMDADGLTTICRSDSSTCAVNQTGGEILKLLDGRHTIAAIGLAVALASGGSPSEAIEAKLAAFVANLGMLGFLREPFYACIVDSKDV